MVRAILAGTKTQTRRVVKPQPERRHIEQVGSMLGFKKRKSDGFWLWPNARENVLAECPYGQPGDRLWVRETWAHGLAAMCAMTDEEGPFVYAATHRTSERLGEKWVPSIHMPATPAVSRWRS